MVRSPAVALALLASAACTHGPQHYEDLSDDLRTASVVSVSGPGGVVRPPARYVWLQGSGAVLGEGEVRAADVAPVIEDALRDAFTRRGLQAARNPDETAFAVGWLLVQGDAIADAEISAQFGLRPSAREHEHGDGTIVLQLVRTNGIEIWRGSIEGAAAPDLPPAVRAERLRRAVERLVANAPIAR